MNWPSLSQLRFLYLRSTVGIPKIERRVFTNTFYLKRLSKKVLHILRASNYKKLKLVTIQHNKINKGLLAALNLYSNYI
jgi:hypothetical protein